jgi:UDP-N-acetylglucosamine enolpyruvyl transferase
MPTRRRIPFTPGQKRIIELLAFGPGLLWASVVDLTDFGRALPEPLRAPLVVAALVAGGATALRYIEHFNRIERKLIAEGKL